MRTCIAAMALAVACLTSSPSLADESPPLDQVVQLDQVPALVAEHDSLEAVTHACSFDLDLVSFDAVPADVHGEPLLDELTSSAVTWPIVDYDHRERDKSPPEQRPPDGG